MDFINELKIGMSNPSAICGGRWLSGERSFASINPAGVSTSKPVGPVRGAEQRRGSLNTICISEVKPRSCWSTPRCCHGSVW